MLDDSKKLYRVQGKIPLDWYDAYLLENDGHSVACCQQINDGGACMCGHEQWLDSLPPDADEFYRVIDYCVRVGTVQEALEDCGISRDLWPELTVSVYNLDDAHHWIWVMEAARAYVGANSHEEAENLLDELVRLVSLLQDPKVEQEGERE